MSTPKASIKHTLYKLKRRFPTTIGLYKRVNITTNTQTGVKTTTIEKVNVVHAIVMQARDFRSFVYDLAFISANKDFTMGGYFDPSDRKVIIEKSDLPVDYVLTADHYIVINNTQYKVIEFNDYDYGYVLLIRALRGERTVRLEEGIDIMIIEQTVVVTKTKLEYYVESILDLTDSPVGEN